MSVENIKKEGIRKALFEAVCKALWQAGRCAEQARTTENAKFLDFKSQVECSRQWLDEAEECYAELLKCGK